MDFATFVIIASALGGVFILASMIYFSKGKDCDADVLWGLGMGVCLGMIIGSALLTSYWEKRLIKEGFGKYEITNADSREAQFKLVKPAPVVIKETITELDKGETCTCPNCNWVFLSPKAEKNLCMSNRAAYNEYLERQKKEMNKPSEKAEQEPFSKERELKRYNDLVSEQELKQEYQYKQIQFAKKQLELEKIEAALEIERAKFEAEKAKIKRGE